MTKDEAAFLAESIQVSRGFILGKDAEIKRLKTEVERLEKLLKEAQEK